MELIRPLRLAAVLFLLLLAWGALHGGIRQLPLSRTAPQQVQTAVQLACGLLTLLITITAVGWPRRRSAAHRTWLASLAVAAGLSALVWGPPMPVLALVFAVTALLAGRAALWALGYDLNGCPVRVEFPQTRAHASSSDLSEPSVSRCWKGVSPRGSSMAGSVEHRVAGQGPSGRIKKWKIFSPPKP